MPKLTYLGHAAFLVQGSEGSMVIDPFLSKKPPDKGKAGGNSGRLRAAQPRTRRPSRRRHSVTFEIKIYFFVIQLYTSCPMH